MPRKNSNTPLYVQIKEYISNQIELGKYPVNSQLPTEQQLMKQFGVGRVTVRTALEQLENEGKVVKRHGIGTFVAKQQKIIGFEPLLSLSYSLERLGVESRSSTVETKPLIIDKNSDLAKKFGVGTSLHLIKRIRYANKFPIGIEYDYIIDDIYNNIAKEVENLQSITNLFFYKLKSSVSKLEETFEFKKPDYSSKAQLALRDNERILEMDRWIYCDDNSTPSAYIEFIISEKYIDVPFSAMRK